MFVLEFAFWFFESSFASRIACCEFSLWRNCLARFLELPWFMFWFLDVLEFAFWFLTLVFCLAIATVLLVLHYF